MQNELLMKRAFLKNEMRMGMIYFMTESDKEKSRKILEGIRACAKKIEEINCELAYIELQKKLKGKGESK